MKFSHSVSAVLVITLLISGCSGTEAKPNPQSEKVPIHVEDIDGNSYQIIQIGEQVWMSENLRTMHYRNGEEIPSSLGRKAWKTRREGMRCAYDDDDANSKQYGQLYNWYAVKDDRGLCPSGWHVPSIEEWGILEQTLGHFSFDWEGRRGRHGVLMKSNAWNGNNSSGFSGLPGGGRDSAGYFRSLHKRGYWWSSSDYAYYLALYDDGNYVGRGYYDKRGGFSVRCVRD